MFGMHWLVSLRYIQQCSNIVETLEELRECKKQLYFIFLSNLILLKKQLLYIGMYRNFAYLRNDLGGILYLKRFFLNRIYSCIILVFYLNNQ